jgi:hypothetical protein
VRVANGTASLDVEPLATPVPFGDVLHLEGTGRGLTEVELRQGARVLASAPVQRGKWEIDVSTGRLGLGALALQVRGVAAEGPAVRSAPIPVEVSPPAPMPATVEADPLALPGLRVVVTDEDGTETEGAGITLAAGGRRTLRQDLEALGVEKIARVRIDGAFQVKEAGPRVLTIHAASAVRIELNGREVVNATEPPASGVVVVPLALEPGWHAIVLEAGGAQAAQTGLELTGVPLQNDDLSHVTAERKLAAEPEERSPEAPEYLDGRRGGKDATITDEGIVLDWKRSQKDILSVVLFPWSGRDAPAFPDAWVVETRSTSRGRWRPVRNPVTITCPDPARPARDRPSIPRYVEIRFDRTSTRHLRIRPAEGATPLDARITELEVRLRDRSRR